MQKKLECYIPKYGGLNPSCLSKKRSGKKSKRHQLVLLS